VTFVHCIYIYTVYTCTHADVFDRFGFCIPTS